MPGLPRSHSPGRAPARTDQGARALEHDGAVVALEQAVERRQSIALDVLRAATRAGVPASPGCGVRIQSSRAPLPALGEQIERVRIDHQRLVRGEHRLQRAARPARAPKPRADRDHVGALERPRRATPRRLSAEQISSGRPAAIAATFSGRYRHRDEPRADAQAGLPRKARRARHAAAAADDEHAAEVALVGGARAARQGLRGSPPRRCASAAARTRRRRRWRAPGHRRTRCRRTPAHRPRTARS